MLGILVGVIAGPGAALQRHDRVFSVTPAALAFACASATGWHSAICRRAKRPSSIQSLL
jgi:hypothetical protein